MLELASLAGFKVGRFSNLILKNCVVIIVHDQKIYVLLFFTFGGEWIHFISVAMDVEERIYWSKCFTTACLLHHQLLSWGFVPALCPVDGWKKTTDH